MVKLQYKWAHAGDSKRITELLYKDGPTSKAISFSGLRLGENEGVEIATALSTSTVCRALDYCNNNFGPRGAIAMSEASLSCPIYTMCLHTNGIGDEGMIAFAEALKSDTCYLRELYLASNNITSVGAIALADALKVNTRLFAVYLSGNDVGETGGLAFEEALKQNSTMTTLRLGHNSGVSPETQLRIQALLQENTRNQKEFFNEVLSSATSVISHPWHQAKLMVIGQGRAGKTSTIRSLSGKLFNPDVVASTVGVETSTVKALSLWENTKRENDAYLKEISVRILSSEVHSPGFRQKREMEKKKKKNTTKESTYSPVAKMLVSKHDTTKVDNMLMEAQDDEGAMMIDIWDYGGQDVFHTLHHLLLTEYGLYLLIFNASDMLSKSDEAVKYLMFWLESVKVHAPTAPVIIAGTHAETLSETEIAEVDAAIGSLISTFQQVVVPSKIKISGTPKTAFFFPVSNLTGTGVQDLRESINTTVSTQPYVNRPVSLKWLKCLDELLNLSNKDMLEWVSLKTVIELARESNIKSMEEIELMLNLFHRLGKLIHFTATENLKSIVVLKPQWMVDKIAAVIRDKDLHSHDESRIQMYKNKGVYEDYKRLYESGVASRILLESLWEYEQGDFLIDLMRETLLISDYGTNEDGEECYLIPSLLTSNDPIDNHGFEASCWFDFSKSVLPNGVFERLACLLISFNNKKKSLRLPSLSTSKAMIWLEEDQVICLEEIDKRINLTCSDKTASQSYRIVTRMLEKVNHDVMKSRLVWETFFEGPNGKLIAWSKAKKKKLKPWFEGGLRAVKEKDPVAAEFMDLSSFLNSL
mmetsp:Transcript_6848/g.7872  ORF Transcript_6848/g.7872 Transcript_6848/m.7872 type:complete len:815 (+) Transcript_6848:286-2730(+)